jgi:hypothetical protein
LQDNDLLSEGEVLGGQGRAFGEEGTAELEEREQAAHNIVPARRKARLCGA